MQYHENILDKLLFHMKAKFIALNTATSEAKFLKNILCNLSLLNKRLPPIPMHCDRGESRLYIGNLDLRITK